MIKREKKLLGDYNPKKRYGGNLSYSKELIQESVVNTEKDKLDKQMSKGEKMQDNKINRVIKTKKTEKICERVTITGAEYLFGKKLSNVFMNSLNLDESYVSANKKTIANYFMNKLNEMSDNDITGLMNSTKNNSYYLSNLVESCKSKAKKVSKKIQKKLSEDDDSMEDDDDFDIEDIFDSELADDDTDDSYEDIDLSDTDDDEVSNTVKEKVISVIKQEEDITNKKKELIDDINNSNNTLKESISLHKRGAETHSLFHSIMIDNHKQCIKALQEGKNIGEYGTMNESGEMKINMDYVFMDTILEYTRLELLNTIKVTNYSPKDLRELAYNYTYN